MVEIVALRDDDTYLVTDNDPNDLDAEGLIVHIDSDRKSATKILIQQALKWGYWEEVESENLSSDVLNAIDTISKTVTQDYTVLPLAEERIKQVTSKRKGFSSLVSTLKGSAASGNFGHGGRLGKRGGSAPQATVLAGSVTSLTASSAGAGAVSQTSAQTISSGAYPVASTHGNKKTAINQANKQGAGFVAVRVNGTYTVLDTRSGPGTSVQEVLPTAVGKAGLPAGQYVSVYSVATNKKAAVAKATALGPGHTAVRVNNAYHVLRTSGGAAAATSSAAKATNKPATVKQLFDNATPAQQKLAKQTGILPTDAIAQAYVKGVVVPNAPNVPKKGWNQHNTIALSTMSTGDATATKVKFQSSWDKKNHTGFKGTIKTSFKITHPAKVQKAFDKAVEETDNVKKGLYHGTDVTAAVLISSGGFRVPKQAKAGRMLGDGVYLAENSSKSVQYLGFGFGRRGRSRGVLFQTTAAMGNMENTKNKQRNDLWHIKDRFAKRGLKPGIDSVYAPKNVPTTSHQRLVNSEYVVSNPKAVLPDVWLDVQRN